MNKIIKIVVAMILLIIQVLVVTSKTNAANVGETKDLERGDLGYYCIQKWNGERWIYLTYNQTFYTDTDGQKYIAYCLSPGLPGVGYVSGEKETYQVKINEVLNNDVLWRVLKNGYPTKSVEELGVETADDAYFATMQALNSILRGYSLEQVKELYCVGQFGINGANYEDVQRRGTKTLNTIINLVDIGLNGKETRSDFLNISVEKASELVDENEKFYSQTFKVKSSAEISKYVIDKLTNLPEGSYTADLKGDKKESFGGGESFKIMISKNGLGKEIKGNISIKAIQKNYPIYYGASQVEGFQDYALCSNSYSEVNSVADIYAQLDKSKLIILKIDSETKKPLKGVKFKITNPDGITNIYTTDNQGKICLANLRPGTIIINEIETVEKYKIKDDEIKLNIKYNEVKEIEYTNELQKGNIKVIKVDKDENKVKIENVKFELKDGNGEVVKEGLTDKNGELKLDNLVIGKYFLKEIETGEEYVLSDKEYEIEVENEKTKELIIENEKIKIPEPEKPKEEPKKEEPKQKKPKEEPKKEEPKEETKEETPKEKHKKEEKKPVREKKKVIVEKKEIKKLPKTGGNDLIFLTTGNGLLTALYSAFAVIKIFFIK